MLLRRLQSDLEEIETLMFKAHLTKGGAIRQVELANALK